MAIRQKKEVDGNAVSPRKNPEVAPVVEIDSDFEEEIEESDDDSDADLQDLSQYPIALRLSKSLLRKLVDYSREEGITKEELAAELISEGVVIRAWEIVEKRATMRGGNANQANQNSNFNNRNGNTAAGNQSNSPNHNQNNPRQFQQGGNKMAQRKLQRQTRQHANAMDLMSDKAAFLEYVRNQEKKRR